MGLGAAELVARIIDRVENRSLGAGRPPMPTIRVVEALCFFLRESVQWRELRATAARACGSTLRRRLKEWSGTAVLRQVHAVLVHMVRSGPETASWDVVVDSCSVRAKHGGELTGPNPRGPHVILIAWGGPPIGAGHGVRCVVEHGCAWPLANKRLDRRQDRQGRMILALLQAACLFIVANRVSAL